MSDYTTKTASLKATNIDARFIETKVLKINGETFTPFDPSTIETDVATKLTFTVSSVNNNTLSYEGYQINITNGTLTITKTNGEITTWQPIQITINGNSLMTQFYKEEASWKTVLWEAEDDLALLYGGVSDTSVIEVVIIVNGQVDGSEDVMTVLSGNVQHNIVYHLGEMRTLNLTLPTILNENYAAEIVFTSGATATVVTSDSRIKWVGDDIVSGVFKPITNTRYSCTLQYDGVFVRGMAFGIPTV